MNIVKLKNAIGLYQSEVAKRAKISVSYYCMIERQQRKPSVKVAKQLARIFNIPEEWYKLL